MLRNYVRWNSKEPALYRKVLVQMTHPVDLQISQSGGASPIFHVLLRLLGRKTGLADAQMLLEAHTMKDMADIWSV